MPDPARTTISPPGTRHERVRRVSVSDVPAIKGMLRRGDDQQSIGYYFGINGGRIAEINRMHKFGEIKPLPENRLPPPGPYPTGREAMLMMAELVNIRDHCGRLLARVDALTNPDDLKLGFEGDAELDTKRSRNRGIAGRIVSLVRRGWPGRTATPSRPTRVPDPEQVITPALLARILSACTNRTIGDFSCIPKAKPGTIQFRC